MIDPTERSSALAGTRVLALEQAVAGPLATHILADHGAEIIKIERPGVGDVIRGWDNAVRGLSSGYVWLNRAKRSVAVDMKTEGGRSVLRKLASRSDVLVANLGPGALERSGLGYAAIAPLNPRLIYCNISGYGLTGPYRDVKAYDLLLQGEAGIIATTGYPDAPAKVGIPISDIAAASYAATAILIALHQRDRTGVGQLIDISMFDATLEWLGYFPHHYWHLGEEPARVGMRHHYVVPYGPYLAADDVYVNISVASASDWQVFCDKVLRRSDVLKDPRFGDAVLRRQHRAEVDALIEEVFRTEDSDEWMQRLKAANLPHGTVRGISGVLSHPQVEARGLIRLVDSPVGPVPTIESPIRLSSSRVSQLPIPALGGDTDAVLRDAGYEGEEIEALRRDGAIQ